MTMPSHNWTGNVTVFRFAGFTHNWIVCVTAATFTQVTQTLPDIFCMWFSKKLNFCRIISMLFSSLAQQTIESTRCREKPVAKSSSVINVSCERLPASCIRYCNKLSLRNLAFFPCNLLLSLQLVVLFPETERFNSFSKLDWWSIFLHFSLHTHSLAPQVHKQIHFSAQISQHVCRIGFWDGIAVNDF